VIKFKLISEKMRSNMSYSVCTDSVGNGVINSLRGNCEVHLRPKLSSNCSLHFEVNNEGNKVWLICVSVAMS
jgi:hypothetical protein